MLGYLIFNMILYSLQVALYSLLFVPAVDKVVILLLPTVQIVSCLMQSTGSAEPIDIPGAVGHKPHSAFILVDDLHVPIVKGMIRPYFTNA